MSSRTIQYTLHDYMYGPQAEQGDLVALLLDYPYTFPYAHQEKDIRLIPPFQSINDLLKSGGDEGGMSPGCTWEPFAITIEEYEQLVRDLLSYDFETERNEQVHLPSKLILDETLNNEYPETKDWEKQHILKYMGVHEFIEFIDDDQHALFLDQEKIGTIEIFGTAGGPSYLGVVDTGMDIKHVYGRRKWWPKRLPLVSSWRDHYQKVRKAKWYELKGNLQVSDSWDRQPKVLEAYLSRDKIIVFKTDFKPIAPSMPYQGA